MQLRFAKLNNSTFWWDRHDVVLSPSGAATGGRRKCSPSLSPCARARAGRHPARTQVDTLDAQCSAWLVGFHISGTNRSSDQWRCWSRASSSSACSGRSGRHRRARWHAREQQRAAAAGERDRWWNRWGWNRSCPSAIFPIRRSCADGPSRIRLRNTSPRLGVTYSCRKADGSTDQNRRSDSNPVCRGKPCSHGYVRRWCVVRLGVDLLDCGVPCLENPTRKTTISLGLFRVLVDRVRSTELVRRYTNVTILYD